MSRDRRWHYSHGDMPDCYCHDSQALQHDPWMNACSYDKADAVLHQLHHVAVGLAVGVAEVVAEVAVAVAEVAAELYVPYLCAWLVLLQAYCGVPGASRTACVLLMQQLLLKWYQPYAYCRACC